MIIAKYEGTKQVTFLPSSHRRLDAVTKIVLSMFINLNIVPTEFCASKEKQKVD